MSPRPHKAFRRDAGGTVCFGHSSLGTCVGSGCVDAFDYRSGDIQDIRTSQGLGEGVGGLGPEQAGGWAEPAAGTPSAGGLDTSMVSFIPAADYILPLQ